MALSKAEVQALVKGKGWSFVDIAARWGVSVTWMSRLVNNPHERAPMYDDAFRGLPQREKVTVVREPRHVRKLSAQEKAKRRAKNRPWTPAEMFPAGRLFEATDNRLVEEGTRLVALGVIDRAAGTHVAFRLLDGEAAGEMAELPMQLAQAHFADLGLDHEPALDVQR